jgi:hypothetical protein
MRYLRCKQEMSAFGKFLANSLTLICTQAIASMLR